MGNTHKVAFSREVDKVMEYFNKINALKDEIGKHYANMKLIFSLLENSEFKDGKKKIKKWRSALIFNRVFIDKNNSLHLKVDLSSLFLHIIVFSEAN